MCLLASCSSVQISKRRYSHGFSLDFRRSGAEANQRPAASKKTKKAAFTRTAREFSTLLPSDSLPVPVAADNPGIPAVQQPATVKTLDSERHCAAAVKLPAKVRHQKQKILSEPAPPVADTAFTATHIIVFSVVLIMIIGYLMAGNWIAGLVLIVLLLIALFTDFESLSCCL